MKTFLPSLPAALFTATIFFSCNADHAPGSADESRVMADSMSYAPQRQPEEQAKSFNRYDGDQKEDAAASGMTILDESANKKAFFDKVFSSSAARPNALDSTHRFIRTADIRFRVKDVISSTYAIENVTARFGGYVANTHLASETMGQYTTRISEDSSLETMRFRVTNTIVLRVPAAHLDTTLKSLVPLIDFLDYRNVTTNDITLDVLANQLQQKRQANYNARLTSDIDTKGKKLDDVQSAEQSVLSSQERADNALIDNLRLDDQVRYSTVTLNIYQHEAFRQELVKNEKTISSYEPGLGDKLVNAAETGWHGLRAVIVFLVAVWPLWFMGGGVWLFVRWMVRKQK